MLSMKHSHRKFSHFVKRRNKTYLTFNIKLSILYIHVYSYGQIRITMSYFRYFVFFPFKFLCWIYILFVIKKKKKVLHSSGKNDYMWSQSSRKSLMNIKTPFQCLNNYFTQLSRCWSIQTSSTRRHISIVCPVT